MEWWPLDDVETGLVIVMLCVLGTVIWRLLRANGALDRAIGPKPLITPMFYLHYIGVYVGIVTGTYAAKPFMDRLDLGSPPAVATGLLFVVLGGYVGYQAAGEVARRIEE